ncbi:PP2C family protein-serine/threonine phosphatase [Streptomyces halobius]|uniref:Protein phosphatase 2C domain-containing protein n=1 Tax=Streptomyces halobius TaxID=2879846 RepID=A0ABY4MG19_9ACTN|nr:PP2C family serine/threonine-protein phosphatase [Streptomyces halobius]UQA95365.1 protein phosphatase 2C domain-containing protein [Streptomyces halobius]
MSVTGPARCASCDEPLDAGDAGNAGIDFCGRCGADRTAPTAPPEEQPPIALTGAGHPPPYGPPPQPAYAPSVGGTAAQSVPPQAVQPHPVPPHSAPSQSVPPQGVGAAPSPAAAPPPAAVPTPAPAPAAAPPPAPAPTPSPFAPVAPSAPAIPTVPATSAPPFPPHSPSTSPVPATPVGPPPPDPQTRLPYAEISAPPVPGHPPTEAGNTPAPPAAPSAPAVGPRPADPRVAGYEAIADAVAEAKEPVEPPTSPQAPANPKATTAPSEPTTPHPTGLRPPSPQPATPPQGTRICAACRTGTAVGTDGHCEHCGHAQSRERDHMERELAGGTPPAVAAVSDRGHRHHRNEDFFALATAPLPDGTPAVVAVVCDGVSSATRPDKASQAASETAAEALRASLPRGTHPQQAMHDAILAAASAVNALADAPAAAPDEYHQENAPACTLVGAAVGGGLLTVGWVGDSRAYWIPNDRTAPPARLTEDDSWAAQMVANNLMSEAEALADERAHAITGWLGADAYEVEPHTASFKPDGPGVVVVCTDGLWNYAESAAQMAAVLPYDAPARPLGAARTLVAHALDGGGHDNVTVALLPFPAPSGPGRA